MATSQQISKQQAEARWPVRGDGTASFAVIDYFDDFEGPNPHAFLSNFYEGAPVDLDGLIWPTTEHYYQAQKAHHREQAEAIRQAAGPGKAKQMGRRCKLRPDWEAVKINVMLKAVRAKFGQHPSLGAQLIATGEALLVEGNTWEDRIWGCVDGEGENLLGLILMLVRAELRLQSV